MFMLKENFHRQWGGWLTIVLSFIVLFYFFGNVIKEPNQTVFAASGDGLQNYYNQIYHTKYDSSYFRSSSMNYPYGEMIFFTGIQLLPASILKFIDNNCFSISDHIIGIQNMMMLLSIVFASLFIFLIFRHLKMSIIDSALFSICIAFLSPQLDRFGGHFTLACVFMIPLYLYLFLRFYKKPGLILSIIIAFVAFWSFTTHPYLYVMLFIIGMFYWLYWFILKKEKEISVKSAILYCFVQLLLPYVIAQLFSIAYDPMSDRTHSPWGLLFYRAYPEGIFLPLGKPYGQFLYSIFKSTNYIQWEGIAYIGLAGVFGFIILFKRGIQKLIHKKFAQALDVTDNRILNIFFWASCFGLLYSFGLPFILNLEWLADYIGPLKQMRAIGRFAWIFYYVINIASVYIILQMADKYSKKIIVFIALTVIGYDAYLNAYPKCSYTNNKIPELLDQHNILPENEWTKHIVSSDYQAVIPLPYFSIGSENIGAMPVCDEVIKSAYIVGIKTGLPSTGISLSRTSISQTANNLEVSLEPYRKLKVLNDCKNRKPFLVMAFHCSYSKGEQNLIDHSSLIYKGDKMNFYKLPFSTLEHLTDSLYIKTKNEINSQRLNSFGDLQSDGNIKDFEYLNFDSLNSKSSYLGNGAVISKCDEFTKVFDQQIPYCSANTDYIISFWYGNILEDVSSRCTVIITYADSTNKLYKEEYYMIANCIKIIDQNWALCEFKIKLNHAKDKLSVTLKNSQLRNKVLFVDELLIRPENRNIYKIEKTGIVKNNRLYLSN
jgi:hypothetical protein